MSDRDMTADARSRFTLFHLGMGLLIVALVMGLGWLSMSAYTLYVLLQILGRLLHLIA